MFVTVAHDISDADKFWSTAERELPNLPPNLRLHLCTPTKDGRTAFCLWEVDSVESLKKWMEPAIGGFARNDYHEVVAEKAIGLPAGGPSAQSATS